MTDAEIKWAREAVRKMLMRALMGMSQQFALLARSRGTK